ncbi:MULTISPECIES: alpha-D-ribose 1-methylphosphonate 5-triphosphate diphosphatase [Rhodopseudomonas]|uniref:Phosphonate metabolism protein PhnM n=1 Tax=Rhodopseudomonas palustris TaxID=1076 RepID=A0A0D7E2C7_RHOPL|nr:MULTISPECIES: alpha-D-ribose 1-methylphosphonate 5-triphosphate diphosphatase [Rhodopseudomonas]KIZ33747.1 phosphonate metabolism protein PhnM [Rhodopseudomonas palustris]MDF3812995.1 alpha-D-ribose 1-methylphosphonate 5-triphosphate diphosphatase [Rhodopseudomonas sp. BAL398]WOK15598.1 alpha-D-ribose 1-methylphosphonate 5-triphosphate diphosphatase [Rhodopseudomonas sp. BAL398]
MSGFDISGGRVLYRNQIRDLSVAVAGGQVAAIDAGTGLGLAALDAGDLLVLPGIIDIHGDAFERQMMPRPGVDFPIDVALADSDRQAIGNGITTVFHATTWSWEPGLRSGANAERLLSAIETMRPHLAADTRFHLRHETYNLKAEATIKQWIAAGRIDLLAFNDHTDLASMEKPAKRARMVERSGVSHDEFDRIVAEVSARHHEVPGSVARLAEAARAARLTMLSHDDDTPELRQAFRAQGVTIAEFPVNEETAREAAQGGDFIVFGAPNVVRGGSHTGWTKASDMIAKGLCSVLASDYYYPAPLLAAFRLAADGVLALPQAWALVSAGPAAATGLTDRGEIAVGRRADIVLVDDRVALRPRVIAVISGGRLVHLTDADRLVGTQSARRAALANA